MSSKLIVLISLVFCAFSAIAQTTALEIVNGSQVVAANSDFETEQLPGGGKRYQLDSPLWVKMIQADGSFVGVGLDAFGSDFEIDFDFESGKDFSIGDPEAHDIWRAVSEKAREARLLLATLSNYPAYPLISNAIIQEVLFEKTSTPAGHELYPLTYSLRTSDGRAITVSPNWSGGDLELDFIEGTQNWQIGGVVGRTIFNDLISRSQSTVRNFISTRLQESLLSHDHISVGFVAERDLNLAHCMAAAK